MSGSPGDAQDPRRAESAARRSILLSGRAAELARAAAETASAMAAQYEKLASTCPAASPASVRAAAAQRRSAACQRAAARLHENHIRHLRNWLARQDPQELRPVFMSAVAGVTGWHGAVLTLLTDRGEEGLVAASDLVAREAHELEVSLAEGPSFEALRNRSVKVARGPQLERRWPRYGPAVRELGVESVAAAPLHLGSICRGGSLTVIQPASSTALREVSALGEVADALAAVLVATPGGWTAADGDPTSLGVFEREDFQPTLYAAAGMLHERCGYDIADAVALIRAHAFAVDRSVADVADEVIGGASL